MKDETVEAMRLAYGWLWHSFTDDRRVHAARRALADVLGRDERLSGIEAAKAAGATVDESGVLLVDAARATDKEAGA